MIGTLRGWWPNLSCADCKKRGVVFQHSGGFAPIGATIQNCITCFEKRILYFFLHKTPKPLPLHEFFAVTISDQSRAVYRVTYEENTDRLVVEVIALRGESGVAVGSELYGGNLVGITRLGLQLYGDDGSKTYVDQNGQPRRPEAEEITKGYWGDGTAPLVALFVLREDAEECFHQKNLQRCDQRWHKKTKEVLAAIGPNHHIFVVSTGVLRLPIDD